MRVPLSWLGEHVDVDLEPAVLAERLTLLGMEVKGLEHWGAEWRQVIVGELLEVGRHPRADRLSLTKVTLGDGEPLEIVCGATNIAVGQRVPVALPGAVLPGGRRIERAEKMGVVSNGMLCSGAELDLTSDADGILILPPDTPLGTELTELYGDWVLDVDVKPNRGDALSIVGLAREVGAITGEPVRFPSDAVAEAGEPIERRLAVTVEDAGLCPRFVGRWVGGVRVGPSPDRVQMRLQAAGMRPVSNVVDATNYVMLELGKPTHVFDGAAIAAGPDGRRRLTVRRAREGERLETLDHVVRDLDPEALLIADPGGPLALAGVMGGAASEVGDTTTEVVIESAVFDPVSIRRTGQRYGLRSEASLRFEKGQETRLARIGADRVAALVAEWAGGSVAPGRIDSATLEPEPAPVAFRPRRVNRLLGTALSTPDQQRLLERVGIATAPAPPGSDVVVAAGPRPMSVPGADAEVLLARVPTWRRDLAIEADVAEEIARIAGYETIPSITPHTPMPDFRPSPLEVRDRIREILVGAGLTEVVTSALISPRNDEVVAWAKPAGERLSLTNPLSRDHSILRRNLVASLLDVVATNARHGRQAIAVFETGKGYAAVDGAAAEWWRLGLALGGPAEGAHWDRRARPYDLDDVKGIVELLASRLGLPRPAFEPAADEPTLHPGRSATVTAGAGLRGTLGAVHPAILAAWDLKGPLVVAELAIEGLEGGRLEPTRATVPPRQPPVERDLAVVVAEETPARDVAVAIRRHAGDLLSELDLFDVYRGSPLPAGRKSLAHRLVFQAADRTLTDEEIDAAMLTIADGLARDVDGQLRG